jgi:SAM-dependent methyltransferase
MRKLKLLALGLTIALAGGVLHSQLSPAQVPSSPTPSKIKPDVPYVPTPESVVMEMLKLANVTKDDVVYDLGSGDGRLVIIAAQKFAAKRGVGVEINPGLVNRSNENAKEAGVANRVQFVQQDLFTTNFSDASVVTLYLLPKINLQLRPKLLSELKPGTRVVSHAFGMGDWQPDRTVLVPDNGRPRTLYF